MKLKTLAFITVAFGFAYGTHRLIGFLVEAPHASRDTASSQAIPSDPSWSAELRKDVQNPSSLNYGFQKVVNQAAVERSGGDNAPHDTEAARIQAYLDRFSGSPLHDTEIIEQAFSQLPGRENQTARSQLLRTLAAEVVEVEHRPLVRGLALREVKTSLATLHQANAIQETESMDVQYHLQSMYELYLDHSTTEGRDLLLDAAEVIQNVQDSSTRATLAAIYMARFPDRASEMKSHLKGIGVETADQPDGPTAQESATEAGQEEFN